MDRRTWEINFQRGENGEKIVADLLRSKGHYVIPSYDYSGKDGDKAPKLQGMDQGYIIPDLDVSRAGRRTWAEIKTKEKAILFRKKNELRHGIDKRHFQAYQNVQQITGCRVFVFIYEENTGDVLYISLDEIEFVKQEFKNGMVYFPRDSLHFFENIGGKTI